MYGSKYSLYLFQFKAASHHFTCLATIRFWLQHLALSRSCWQIPLHVRRQHFIQNISSLDKNKRQWMSPSASLQTVCGEQSTCEPCSIIVEVISWEEELRTWVKEFKMKFLSFKPSKSHNRLTRICDISNDPTVIHEIWKQFLEGTILHRGIVDDPFGLLAVEVERMTLGYILYPSLLKSVSIWQSWKGGDGEQEMSLSSRK